MILFLGYVVQWSEIRTRTILSNFTLFMQPLEPLSRFIFTFLYCMYCFKFQSFGKIILASRTFIKEQVFICDALM